MPRMEAMDKSGRQLKKEDREEGGLHIKKKKKTESLVQKN